MISNRDMPFRSARPGPLLLAFLFIASPLLFMEVF